MSNIPNNSAAENVNTIETRNVASRRLALVAGAVVTGITVAAIAGLAFRTAGTADVVELGDAPNAGSVTPTPPVSDAIVEDLDAGTIEVEDASDVLGDGQVRNDTNIAENDNPWDIDLEFEDGTAVEVVDEPRGLRQVCINTVHGEGESGIWVRGEVYGLDGGYIYVEGDTINDGEVVEISVVGGSFDAPLPIRQFGDHVLDTFSLAQDPADGDRLDLLATLETGPGLTIPVDADEGPNFDTECFEFEPEGVESVPTVGEDEPAVETPDAPGALDDAAEPISDAGATAPVDPDQIVGDFMNAFVAQHRDGDTAALLESLHPSARVSFGDQVCGDYVERTTGSIAAATVLEVNAPQQLTMRTPDGDLVFPEAIPFTVEFELIDGSTLVNDGHLPINGEHAHWLTMCGVELP